MFIKDKRYKMKYVILPEVRKYYGYCHGCGCHRDCGRYCGGNCGGNCGCNYGGGGGGCRAHIVPIYAAYYP